jgi:uncharacterized protein (DUF433 family)
MAQQTIDYQTRIVRDPAVLVGKPIVKGTQIAVEHVLAALAANPDLDALYREHPELTRDDVRVVLAYALDQIQAHNAPAAPASAVTSREFYATITKQPDVAELMRRLAR